MKKQVLVSFCTICALFLLVTSSCTKPSPAITSINFVNNTYTPITITINGKTSVIPIAGSVQYSGVAGDAATGYASTSGTTSSGGQVGQLVGWNNISYSFPTNTSSIDIPMNIGSDLFFLRINNSSPYSFSQVYVNYGTTDQTLDNVAVPNDGYTYGIGYYSAYSNSNVHLVSASSVYMNFSLVLPFTNNQSITVNAY
jgi:hypothetical protein